MTDKNPQQFAFFKIRTLQDQRFLIVWTIISFFLSVLVTCIIASIYLIGQYEPPPTNHPGIGAPRVTWTPPWEVFGSDKFTFILLGYDEVDEFAHRSDTLMVGTVDFYAKKLKIISIPRDTLLPIPGRSFMKVNSAYALGGDDLVRRTIEDFTGVDIDYVISVNYQGFVEIVDALGGVDITVEHDMNYDDRRGDVHIHIEAGDHHFDGETALDYARYRHDAQGDFGRIERQQNLIRELFQQKLHLGYITRIDNVSRAVFENINVGVNEESPREPPEIELQHIVSLIQGYIKQLDEDDIEFYQVPTLDLVWEGLACLRPIYSQTREILIELFADDEELAWKTVEGTPLPVVPLEPEEEITDGGDEPVEE